MPHHAHASAAQAGAGQTDRAHRRVRTARRSLVGLATLSLGALVLGPGGHAAHADAAFEPGQASANASGYRVDPNESNLSIGVGFGESLSRYIGTEGRGQSLAIDLGTIGTSLAAPSCTGSGGSTLPLSEQPQPLAVDSNDPGADAGKTQSYAGGFTESARATKDPLGSATTVAGTVPLSSAPIDFGTATSTSTAQLIDHATRDASAATDISGISLAGGLVKLSGMHWGVEQKSGAQKSSTSTFNVGSITVAGVALPAGDPSQLASAITAANGALASTGLKLILPVVGSTTSGQVSETSISALRIGVDSSPLGHQIVAPLVADLQAERAALINAALTATCNAATAITILDVVLASFTGGGSTFIDLGGVSAKTDGTTYSSPFGSIDLGDAPPVLGAALPATDTSSVGSTVDTSTAGLGASPLGTDTGTTGTPATTATSEAPSVAAPSSSGLVAALHRGHRGWWVGLLALLGLGSLFLLDLLFDRDDRHVIPEGA